MKRVRFYVYSILLLLIFFCGVRVAAQTLASQLDKRSLGIGEKATLTVKIQDLQGQKVQAAPKNELLPFHFEEIKDEVQQTANEYTRVIDFQVFQEGTFTIPSLEFTIGDKVYRTIPYEVDVLNTADPAADIADIVGNREVKLTWGDYWQLYKFYVLGVLLLAAIIFATYFFLKYGKRQRQPEVVSLNATLKALKALKSKNYIAQDNYRSFYVELLDIVRQFLKGQLHIPADVLLTDDLIARLQKMNQIQPAEEKMLEKLLIRGDMVKFAKTFPDREQMSTDYDFVYQFVQKLSKDIHEEKLRTGV